MYSVLTRAQKRDQIRVELGQIPPIVDGTGVAGAQPTRWPNPTNSAINTAIDSSVAFFSRKCKIAGDAAPRVIPLPIQTANGPFAINLQSIAPFGSVNDVQHVSWQPSGGQPAELTPVSRWELDRDRSQWENTSPGTPRKQWIEHGNLLVWPAPSAAGSLLCIFGVGLWSTSQNLDGEVLDIVPTEWLPVFDAYSAYLLAIQKTNDVEMSARARTLMGIVGINEMGAPMPGGALGDMVAFFARRNRQQQSSFVAETGRTGSVSSRR